MKLGIMQPYFFAYIGYWQLINSVDKFVLYDDVNFIKGGWINRNRVLMNGNYQMINIQMEGGSSNKLINEIGVSQNQIYKRKILKTLEYCYSKAPYFDIVFPLIEDIISQNEKNLSKYLTYLIFRICDYLCIDTELLISSSMIKNNHLKGEDKVIDICKLLKAEKYYNSIGGKELYSYKNFESEGIKLRFLNTTIIEYNQLDDKFVSNLSIIDVMMFNSIEEIKKMLNLYTLL